MKKLFKRLRAAELAKKDYDNLDYVATDGRAICAEYYAALEAVRGAGLIDEYTEWRENAVEVSFEAGESRGLYYNQDTDCSEFKIVNFMIAHMDGGSLYDDDELYAEIVLPDDEEADSFYGYDELKQEIVHQCIEKGYNPAMLEFEFD